MTGGEYQIHGLLGSGGIAHVYDASIGGKPVAIKVLRAELRHDPAYVALIEREGALGMEQDHENLIRIHALEYTRDGVPFLVMERLSGVLLVDTIGHAWTESVLRAVLHSTLEGLAALHAQSIVHCDISPSNVMITDAGVVKLLDYGVAQRTTDATGRIGGSPPYMAPELLLERWDGALEPMVDLYSLAATTYHCIAGAPPYGLGDTTAIRTRMYSGDAPAPFAMAMADDIARAVLGQLTMLHQKRLFRSAREMRDALRSDAVADADELAAFARAMTSQKATLVGVPAKPTNSEAFDPPRCDPVVTRPCPTMPRQLPIALPGASRWQHRGWMVITLALVALIGGWAGHALMASAPIATAPSGDAHPVVPIAMDRDPQPEVAVPEPDEASPAQPPDAEKNDHASAEKTPRPKKRNRTAADSGAPFRLPKR
ncbi:MAG: serine/threonine protein kinase [Proteobacteria bacterium]|nr:serine/threonine protein kinase [Pseudomonadota bacterium]